MCVKSSQSSRYTFILPAHVKATYGQWQPGWTPQRHRAQSTVGILNLEALAVCKVLSYRQDPPPHSQIRSFLTRKRTREASLSLQAAQRQIHYSPTRTKPGNTEQMEPSEHLSPGLARTCTGCSAAPGAQAMPLTKSGGSSCRLWHLLLSRLQSGDFAHRASARLSASPQEN